MRIEINESRGIVRLTGASGQVLDVFSLIYKDLQHIKTFRIKIRDVQAELAGGAADSTQGVLATETYQKYIEELTNTKIVASQWTQGSISLLDYVSCADPSW